MGGQKPTRTRIEISSREAGTPGKSNPLQRGSVSLESREISTSAPTKPCLDRATVRRRKAVGVIEIRARVATWRQRQRHMTVLKHEVRAVDGEAGQCRELREISGRKNQKTVGTISPNETM